MLTKQRLFYVTAKFDDRAGAPAQASLTMRLETGLFSGRPTAAAMRRVAYNFTKVGAKHASVVVVLFMTRVVESANGR